MTFLSSKKETWLAFLLALYCAYYLIVSLASFWAFTTDDAYITWLYARQLAEGQGISWPALIPRVEGYSNFLWLLIASVCIKLHWPLALMMKWISVLSLGSGLVFLYRLGRLFLSPLLAMLPVFIFSHYTGVIWWTVSGLESAFFCALSLLLIGQCAQAFGFMPWSATTTRENPSTGAWIITNLSLLLLALTRFEGLIWTLPIAGFIFCQWRNKTCTKLFAHKQLCAWWGIISLGCFILPYTLYFIWRVYYFGHFLPNSYQCKAFLTEQIGVVDLDYVRVALPLMVASLPYLIFPKDCRHLLLWLPSLLYILLLWMADPVLAHYLRLFLAPFALLSLLAVLGVVQFFQSIYPTRQDWKLMTCLLLILLTFFFIPGNNLPALRALAADYQGRNQNRLFIAKLLNEQAALNATVLLGDCGLIPFYARPDLRFIDSQCLNNAELTQAPYRQNRALYVTYLREQVKPDWVIVSKPLLDIRSDPIISSLEQTGFLTHYQLVAQFQSGAVLPDAQGKKTIDYIYLVYKRDSIGP